MKQKEEQEEEMKRRRHDGLREVVWMAGVATCIKLLLMPAYHSTDFEVHRHWLAITASLPLNQWYLDETSPWTLDYPPFFAWFERALSFPARLVDPLIVDLSLGLNYDAPSVVLFQRSSVIFSDLLLFFAAWRFCRSFPLKLQRLAYLGVLFSPGLFIVDHIHFQYNGFLLGILLLSLSYLRDGEDLMGGIIFAILLCFKHLFAVAAPVYFVYLLRHYCHDLARFLKLGGAVISVVLAAFGPFLYYGQMGQVLQRLFPFGRGLCHAYWAPNFWALYNVLDKVLFYFLRKLGFHVVMPEASMTGGLVGDSKAHAVLPQITPGIAMLLVLLAMVPCLVKLWRKPRKESVLICVAFAYTCGFMFGWHVHEKASLHYVILLGLAAVNSLQSAQEFFFVSTVSYYSLFPLLFEPREYPIKVVLLVLHTMVMWLGFSAHFTPLSYLSEGLQDSAHPGGHQSHTVEDNKLNVEQMSVQLLSKRELVYIFGLVIVETYGQLVHNLLFGERLPFLPLMVVSVYCALGMLYAWIKQLLFVWAL